MNTDPLRLFLVIARHRSLSRAAAELDLGQATVSERLKALETELGAALFDRKGRGVALTSAGEAFKPYAERALDVLREAQDSVRGASEGNRGQVTVAVTVTAGSYLFAPALVAFQREHPGEMKRPRGFRETREVLLFRKPSSRCLHPARAAEAWAAGAGRRDRAASRSG